MFAADGPPGLQPVLLLISDRKIQRSREQEGLRWANVELRRAERDTAGSGRRFPGLPQLVRHSRWDSRFRSQSAHAREEHPLRSQGRSTGQAQERLKLAGASKC